MSENYEQYRPLINAATAAAEKAYAPYSKFMVGCAILMPDGNIVSGCNVENSSYPTGICAEVTTVCQEPSNPVRDTNIL